MAKEQPAVTRAAVLLAANAYIDEHVRYRVPVGMDPDRVARQSPDWMNEMIELHDSTHGNGYWRHLLQATILETITAPFAVARFQKKPSKKIASAPGLTKPVNS